MRDGRFDMVGDTLLPRWSDVYYDRTGAPLNDCENISRARIAHGLFRPHRALFGLRFDGFFRFRYTIGLQIYR